MDIDMLQNSEFACIMELTEAEKVELLAMWKERKVRNATGKRTDFGGNR